MSEKLKLSDDLLLKKENEYIKCINSSDGAEVKVSPSVVSIYMQLPSVFTYDELIERSTGNVSEHDLQTSYILLRSIEVILPDLDYSNVSKPLPYWNWQEYGWLLPNILLDAVKSTAFVQGDDEGWKEQVRQSEVISKEGSGPEISRSSTANFEFLSLPEPKVPIGIDLFKTIKDRRTKRAFIDAPPLADDVISGILHCAARAQKVYNHPQYGPQMLRSSPSGGARHPIEIYPQLLKTNNFKPGNYLYCPIKHGLMSISEVDENELSIIGQQQKGTSGGSIAFLVTTRYPRNFWKYRYARSFLFSHYDCGHFVQTLLLVLKGYGLDAFITPAVNIDRACNYIDIDDYRDETPSYLIVAG